MANAHSPTRFNGEADNFFDPNYSVEINNKMKVPKNIRVNGEFAPQDLTGMYATSWNDGVDNKLDMSVPDRIILIGQEQHIGTKAPPREIAIENAIITKAESPVVRCVTPPRVLTLDTHYFPSVDEDTQPNSNSMIETPIKPRDIFANDIQTPIRNAREQTPAYGALDITLPPGEEIQHLRRQVGKLNRRVMSIESEIQQQQQRMKIIYAISAIYICLKTIFWFGRN